MKRSLWRWALLPVCAVVLMACGGGGGSNESGKSSVSSGGSAVTPGGAGSPSGKLSYSGTHFWQEVDCGGPPVRIVGNENASPDISGFLRVEEKGHNQLVLHWSDVVRNSTDGSCSGAKLGELTFTYSGVRQGKVTALVEGKQVQADKIVLTGMVKPMMISSAGKTVPAPTDFTRLPNPYQVGNLLWSRDEAEDTFDEADNDVKGDVLVLYTTMLEGQQVLYLEVVERSKPINGSVKLELHSVRTQAKP